MQTTIGSSRHWILATSDACMRISNKQQADQLKAKTGDTITNHNKKRYDGLKTI